MYPMRPRPPLPKVHRRNPMREPFSSESTFHFKAPRGKRQLLPRIPPFLQREDRPQALPRIPPRAVARRQRREAKKLISRPHFARIVRRPTLPCGEETLRDSLFVRIPCSVAHVV